jgi:hypothetical protein
MKDMAQELFYFIFHESFVWPGALLTTLPAALV